MEISGNVLWTRNTHNDFQVNSSINLWVGVIMGVERRPFAIRKKISLFSLANDGKYGSTAQFITHKYFKITFINKWHL